MLNAIRKRMRKVTFHSTKRARIRKYAEIRRTRGVEPTSTFRAMETASANHEITRHNQTYNLFTIFGYIVHCTVVNPSLVQFTISNNECK